MENVMTKLDVEPDVAQVIYCDYDGVLHDDSVYSTRQMGIHIRTPGRTLFEWMPTLEALLAPHPDVKIVLSTSWVRVKSFEFAKRQLSPNLQSRVIGATYHRREMRRYEFDNTPRGVQILADVRRRKPKFWLAIDNDDVGWPTEYRNHLIKTEDHRGLSDPLVQTSISGMLASFARQHG